MKKLSIFQAIKGHLETLGPYFFRRVKLPKAEDIFIPTQDGDFLEAEVWRNQGSDWVILTHGLEGSSKAAYVRSAAKQFINKGKNVMAWNFRACSGKLNKLPRLYHSGAYEDLVDVVHFLKEKENPTSIFPIGFSLGGNLTLVFLAKMDLQWLEKMKVKKGMAISVPLNLAASSRKLEKWHNYPYGFNFVKELKAKIQWKASQFPEIFKTENFSKCQSVWSFDDYFTAPLHGFKDAADYYRQCSSLYHLPNISIPVKILLALNDPMLARGNYHEIQGLNSLVSIEFRPSGGHCGFWGSQIF